MAGDPNNTKRLGIGTPLELCHEENHEHQHMTALYILENLLFPPALAIILSLAGLVLMGRKHKRSGFWLITISLGMLYVLSIPFTAITLAKQLELYHTFDSGSCDGHTNAQAIVVLGYSRDEKGREFGGPVSSGGQMERLRYAAYLHKCYRLPIVVVGGDALNTGVKQADLMKNTLENYFSVPVMAADGRSKHTWDNAAFASDLLQDKGIQRILLVTHAWHMLRSVQLFRSMGFEPKAASTAYTSFNPASQGLAAWIPSAGALGTNKRFAHEIVGLLLYQLQSSTNRPKNRNAG